MDLDLRTIYADITCLNCGFKDVEYIKRCKKCDSDQLEENEIGGVLIGYLRYRHFLIEPEKLTKHQRLHEPADIDDLRKKIRQARFDFKKDVPFFETCVKKYPKYFKAVSYVDQLGVIQMPNMAKDKKNEYQHPNGWKVFKRIRKRLWTFGWGKIKIWRFSLTLPMIVSTGIKVVGEWHSHPLGVLLPSKKDIATIKKKAGLYGGEYRLGILGGKRMKKMKVLKFDGNKIVESENEGQV